MDVAHSGFTSPLDEHHEAQGGLSRRASANQTRVGYPEDLRIEFADAVVDTGVKIPGSPIAVTPAKFKIFAETPQGDIPMKFGFRDVDGDNTLSLKSERIVVVTYVDAHPDTAQATWFVTIDTLGTVPHAGDVYRLRLVRPLNPTDRFVFRTTGAKAGSAKAAGGGFAQTPYVVPNPYLAAASFEPARYAVSGRGERRIEFRAIPLGSTIRIYTVRGDLVQTLRQEGAPDASGGISGSDQGVVAWDLRTKDNLDLAPGLYIYHVDAPGVGTHIGKFAVIK